MVIAGLDDADCVLFAQLASVCVCSVAGGSGSAAFYVLFFRAGSRGGLPCLI